MPAPPAFPIATRTPSKLKYAPLSLRSAASTWRAVCVGCGHGYLISAASLTPPFQSCHGLLTWTEKRSKGGRTHKPKREPLIQEGD